MLDDAREVLEAGQSVIIDAAFLKPEERAEVSDLARRTGRTFTGIWLEAPADLLRERVTARREDASDADTAVVESQLDRDIGALGDWHTIDASGDPQEVAERLESVCAWLSS